ncbi:hypothetical protein GcM1_248179 [Golovinomyces cichoracearum]|uniref:DUF7598 domain-containing protein n=1 Tax=Golovinomyces cichoracearum TaxID=62708 RepID=A0A420ID52_9PEZI|nr:hypothetical protein GcM1_248179 [Golovinomyces cichoracearum]
MLSVTCCLPYETRKKKETGNFQQIENSPTKMSKNINYITLNILRVANIISLILVAVTSWTMLVMTIKAGTFFFFDGVSHLVMSLICVFLITSEISLFNRYFAKHWPALGLKSGFNFLGLSMILVGSGILRNLKEEIVKRGEDDNQVDLGSLGTVLWPLVLSSGILSLLLGVFNIIATYVFCEKAQGITGRQIRMHSNSASTTKPESLKAFSMSSSPELQPSISNIHHYNSRKERRRSRFRFPLSIAKSNQPPCSQDEEQNISYPSSSQSPNMEKIERSLDRASPVVPELLCPPSAHHPAYNSTSPKYPASSRYSVVSNMTRF